MLFLETREGFISHRSIVRIKPLCVDNGQTVYEVSYVHGAEALKTTAVGDDVEDFLARIQ